MNCEWYHRGDSFAEGVAFVHIELFLTKKPIHKSLWLQDDKLALNLFRLCLDARTGWGGRAGDRTKGACPQVRAQEKTSALNF